MICQFCNNEFSNKQNLKTHQTRAKYCLKIQGLTPKNPHKCDACLKTFDISANYRRHTKICKKSDILDNYKEEILRLNEEISILKKENEMLRSDKKDLQDNL